MTKIVIKDDGVTLESPEEALFWGLCSLWKIPVERAERSKAVQVNENGWYCPDFYLPGLNIWAEVKGYEDDDDRKRYAAWAAQGEWLIVLNRDTLILLRAMRDEDEFTGYLTAIFPEAARDQA